MTTQHAADISVSRSPDRDLSATRAAEPQTYVSFELAGQAFAADVRNVREILDLQPISRLPNASHDLLGMIDIRGAGVAVIDLCGRLALMSNEVAEDGRIIVFELGQERATPIGVVADRVLGVVEIGSAEIEAAPETMTHWDGSAVCGIARVGGTLTMLLALDRLFGDVAADPFNFS